MDRIQCPRRDHQEVLRCSSLLARRTDPWPDPTAQMQGPSSAPVSGGMESCCRKRQSSLPCLDPTAQMQGPTRVVVRTRLRQTGMARSAAGRRPRPGPPSNRDTLHSAAVSEDFRRTPGPCRRLRFGSARTRPGIRTVRLNTTSLWQQLNEVQLRITMQHRRSRYSHSYRHRRRSSPALQARLGSHPRR